jgi:hypothetical protein
VRLFPLAVPAFEVGDARSASSVLPALESRLRPALEMPPWERREPTSEVPAEQECGSDDSSGGPRGDRREHEEQLEQKMDHFLTLEQRGRHLGPAAALASEYTRETPGGA